MNDSAKSRTHDLLWAAFIVLALGALLIVVRLMTQRDLSSDDQLSTEADEAIASGDRAAAQTDYDGARQQYRQALDLLRAVPGNLDERRAAIQLKIINTHMSEGSFQKAKERLQMLHELFPAFQPAHLAALERQIDAGLRGLSTEVPPGDRAGEAPPPKTDR